MQRTVRFVALVLLGLTALPGCAYLKDRGNDLMDIAGAELALGDTSLVNVRVSKALQLGFGRSSADVLSWHGRRLAFYEERREEVGTPMMTGAYFVESERHVHAANNAYLEWDRWDEAKESTWDYEKDMDRGFSEVGFRLPFFCFGFGAHVDPFQICDFLLGIFYIDFARDDSRNSERRPVTGPPVIEYPDFPPEGEVN